MSILSIYYLTFDKFNSHNLPIQQNFSLHYYYNIKTYDMVIYLILNSKDLHITLHKLLDKMFIAFVTNFMCKQIQIAMKATQ